MSAVVNPDLGKQQFAIVAQACRFPGAASPEALWQQLLAGADCRSELTDARLGASVQAYTGAKGESDRFYCTKGGFIGDFSFDADGLNLPPDELASLDISRQWLLSCAREALNQASVDDTQRPRTGIILGALSFPDRQTNAACLPLYHQRVQTALREAAGVPPLPAKRQQSAPTINLNNASDAATQVTRALGLGPCSFSLDAACASSLYAIRLACDYLANDKADVMLAAALSGADPLFVHMGFSIFQAYPQNGISAPFSPDSQGLFAGEGAAVLVIKRLADARANGDNILGVIQGVGLSNDGRGQFVLSPNPKGQQAAFERAWQIAGEKGLTPRQLEVIECHATGTPLGDRVELASMARFLADQSEANLPLIGSAKGNVGHLLTAAGMVSMVKTLQAMAHDTVPASPGLIQAGQSVSSAGNNAGSENHNPMTQQIITRPQPWPSQAGKADETADSPQHRDAQPSDTTPSKPTQRNKIAAVSAFGFGGCNAHLVLSHQPLTPTSAEALPPDKEWWPSQQPTKSSPQSVALTITGLAAHIGTLDSLSALADRLHTQQSALRPLPPKRWKGLQALLPTHPKDTQPPLGGYIAQFELDMMQFKLPATEQDRLIPQQLLLLKQADEAIRDAGLLPGSKTAVLVAMETEPELHQFRGRVELHTLLPEYLSHLGIKLSDDEYAALEPLVMDAVLGKAQLNQYTSFIGNIMASRVAALWDFSGPAFTLSAGELGFTRGLEVAAQLLRAGDADAVVLCAVDLAGSAERVLLGQKSLPPADGAGAMVLTLAQPRSQSQSQSQTHPSAGYGTLQLPLFGRTVPTDPNPPAIQHLRQTQNELVDTLLTSHAASPQLQVISGGSLPETVAGEGRIESSIEDSIKDSTAKMALPADSICYPARLLGYPGAAAGLFATLTAMVSDAQTSLITAIEGEFHSALLLEQTPLQMQALRARLQKPVVNRKGPSLPKIITLGGDDIADLVRQAVIKAGLSHRASAKNKDTDTDTDTDNDYENENNKAAGSTNTMAHGAVTDMNTSLSAADKQVLTAHRQQLAEVHLAFLNARRAGLAQADVLLRRHLTKLAIQPTNRPADLAGLSRPPATSPQPPRTSTQPEMPDQSAAADHASPAPMTGAGRKDCIWDYEDLLEYAEGDIARVFGPQYAEIDSFRRRVRLPSRDYLLVSRVTKLDATLSKQEDFKPCNMTTEYDIPHDAPYLVDGQIPWAVAVESGQCDLMLISYLGIDFENRGERVYRLLDCTLTFLGDLPRGGDTLRYDIAINHFARNGDTLLFFFSYRCYVGDQLILKMDNGCAGFFTDRELEDGKGVIRTQAEETARQQAPKSRFTPLLECHKTRFSREELEALLRADLVTCFGPSHAAQAGSNPQSLRFASRKFMMIEQISALDPQGGAWGLGMVEGHKWLAPDHWYFPCHFKDDEVMAGSLMAEGCGQLLQFYMLWLGMHKSMGHGRFQPLVDAPQKVRCRGQVLPQSGMLTYRMEVTELSMHPTPRARANIDILLNGKVVVDFQNLGVMLKEETNCTRYGKSDSASVAESRLSELEPAPLMQKIPDFKAPTNKGVIPFTHVQAPEQARFANRQPDTLPFTPWHLFEFATGNIEHCFGPEFAVYRGMVPPRTPCGDLQLTTCVTRIDGQRGEFKTPSACRAEYEVPADAWYFRANSHPAQMPYSVLMEIALQPNGFLSGYLGTTLSYQDEPLFFRNLDGQGRLLRPVDLRGQTIINDTQLLSTVFAGANIIQTFKFTLSTRQAGSRNKTEAAVVPFYEGEAVFGYFNDHALTHQAGLDRGQTRKPWHVTQGIEPDIQLELTAANAFNAPPGKPHWHLAGGQLNFVDSVAIVASGGEHGLGYVYGKRSIDASDWFFPCHFHQDPVMPGSLGVEAMLELLQAFAIKTGLGDEFVSPRSSWPQSLVKWKYRGQITPHNQQMSLELHITAIERTASGVQLKADASLSKDQLRIYQISDLAIMIVEASDTGVTA
ncbi:beta-ketoacyl synthase N-terminal-like domain-containing protein [Shewanella sp. GXUN23E]|uniref:hotdog fold thioesterase n=1 Tax=Shewanella sp. GXUN23E TaxID=3422498 RepID=UPI003D7DBDA4